MKILKFNERLGVLSNSEESYVEEFQSSIGKQKIYNWIDIINKQKYYGQSNKFNM